MSQASAASIRYASLAFLVVQDTTLVLCMRLSRSRPGPMYVASTAVCCAELLKLAICFAAVYVENGRGFVAALRTQVFRPRELARLSLPAVLYVVQNNLLYVALSNLRATPYKVTYNLKLLTAAFFSAAFLKERLGRRRWLSLVALFVGVVVVQAGKHEASKTAPAGNAALGFFAVAAAATTSGFAGVYQQKILQGTATSVWCRNIQMGLPSVVVAAFSTLKDAEPIAARGFFGGYSNLVWFVVVLQAVGGLNVSFILKYAGSILKGFAAGFATLGSCVAEMALFGFRPTPSFLAGGALINAAAYAYSTAPRESSTPRSPKSKSPLPLTTQFEAKASPKPLRR